MKRRFVWLIVICVLLSVLVSCGAKEMPDVEKGEEISARFTQDYNQHQFISIDVSVDSVQRNSEEDAEETWGQVVGETETIIITCPYYSKHSYEEGSWSLKQLRFGDAEFEIKVEPITENALEVDVGTVLRSDYCNDALSIDNIVINNRGTDYDLLEETISFTVNVSETDASGWFAVEALYALEGNGWSLTDWHVLDSGITEIFSCSVPQEVACADMLSAYAEQYDDRIDDCVYVTHDCVDASNTAEFVFQVIQQYGYYSQAKTTYLSYSYTLKDGWSSAGQIPSAPGDYVGTWDVIGEWLYEDSHNRIWINIISIDNNQVTYEYDMDYTVPHESGWYGNTEEQFDISSSGPITESMDPVGDHEHAVEIYLDIEDSTNNPSFYFYPYKGLCYSGRIYNADDTYILSYENKDKSLSVLADSKSDWPEESLLLYDEPVVHHVTGLTLSTLEFDYGNKDLDDGDNDDDTVHDDVMYYADDNNKGPASNTYNLYGKYHTLTGTIFQMQGAPLGNSSKARIYGDGTLLYSFDGIAFTEQEYTENFEIDVTGVWELTVEFTGETYRRSVFLATYDAPFIGLAELTAHIRETASQEQVAASESEETPEPEVVPELEETPPQEVEDKESTTQLMLLKTIIESQFGDTVLTTEIQYNDNNEPYKTHCISLSGGYDSDVSYDVDTSSATESCYQETMEGNGDAGSQWYFKNGRVVQRYDFYANGENQWINYEYDESGVLQAASSTASLGGSFVCVFRYDENGELCEYARDETNNWGDKYVNKYTVENIKDASGNLVQRRYYEDGDLAIEQNYQDGRLVETNNIQAEYKTTYEYESITVNESDLPRWYYDSTLLLP